MTGTVYLLLTNNTNRTPDKVDGPNPRARNKHGHVIELVPPASGAKVDQAALRFRWNILLLAGDPRNPEEGARYHGEVTESGWLSRPDNCAVDGRGRLWIATDGAPGAAGFADGIWGTDTVGAGRALTRHFLRTPRGAELCGPFFTPDDRTLFVAVQHPGDEKGLDRREAGHPLAGLQPELAATPLGGGDYQGRRRSDRLVASRPVQRDPEGGFGCPLRFRGRDVSLPGSALQVPPS